MNEAIPKTMQAVLLERDGGPFRVEQIPVPEPGPGQVLVRMAASPVNPSDLGFIAGGYGPARVYPVVPGIEGSGTVVAAGPGLLPRLLMGRRVACARSTVANGTWAEYMVTRASVCIPLQRSVSFEQGAMLVVNPITALVFMDLIKQGRHAALVNTAAASQLGRMLVRLCLKRNIPLINIVRRVEQAGLLESLGARHVLVSSEPGFDERLKELSQKLKASLVLDAVAGEFTQRLIDAAPAKSVIVLYSNLSREPAQIIPHSLWNEGKRVEGFYLATWASGQNLVKVLSLAWQAQRLAGTDLHSDVAARLPLSAAQGALTTYQKNMSAGKIMFEINPDGSSPDGR